MTRNLAQKEYMSREETLNFCRVPVMSGWTQPVSRLILVRRERRNFSLRIEMHRLPAQFTPGFLAAQLLVHRAATSPGTEFGGNCIGGNNLRCVIAQTKSLRDRPLGVADRQTRNRRVDVTRSRSTPLQRQ